jgi:hypothetical protein
MLNRDFTARASCMCGCTQALPAASTLGQVINYELPESATRRWGTLATGASDWSSSHLALSPAPTGRCVEGIRGSTGCVILQSLVYLFRRMPVHIGRF